MSVTPDKKWVRISSQGFAQDPILEDPAKLYPPEMASMFTEVPMTVVRGSRLVDGVWYPPYTPEGPQESNVFVVSPNHFALLWKATEMVYLKSLRVKNAEGVVVDPLVDVYWERLENSTLTEVNLHLSFTVEAVTYCVEKLIEGGLIDRENKQTRIDEILSGQLS